MRSHSTSYPSEAKPPNTSPAPRCKRPATFSTKTRRGRKSRTSRSYCGQSHRGSSCASLRPAAETGWQGKPPTIISTGSRSAPVTEWISRYRGTSGQRRAKRSEQKSSISTCHRQVQPLRSRPRSRPPIPEKSEPKVGIHFDAGTVGTGISKLERSSASAMARRLRSTISSETVSW